MDRLVYLTRARRVLRAEWRHTFLSARREYATRYAARLFVRELVKGLTQVRQP